MHRVNHNIQKCNIIEATVQNNNLNNLKNKSKPACTRETWGQKVRKRKMLAVPWIVWDQNSWVKTKTLYGGLTCGCPWLLSSSDRQPERQTYILLPNLWYSFHLGLFSRFLAGANCSPGCLMMCDGLSVNWSLDTDAAVLIICIYYYVDVYLDLSLLLFNFC